MFWDDLRRLLNGPTLFRLDAIIATKLVPILYALGLAAIGLWAIDHLFASFAFNFGQGLWGILEIAVYGPLWLIALRVVCELILVYFKAHQAEAASVGRGRAAATLIEDVGAAIHDLAEDDDALASVFDPPPPPPPGGHGGSTPPLLIEPDPPRPPAVRRTAKRSPPAPKP
jgi:hypothetical protein